MMNKNEYILSALSQVLVVMSRATLSGPRLKKMLALSQILLKGEKGRFFQSRFKFDFSCGLFSPGVNAVRFSMNGWGEDLFREKIRDMFLLFGKAFDVDELKNVLSCHEGSPFTVGMDWRKGSRLPVLKVYYEVAQGYQGMGKGAVALGFNFLPQRRLQVKVYRRYDHKLVCPILSVRHIRKVREFDGALELGKDSFALEALGYKDKDLVAYRMYKIYDTGEFQGCDCLPDLMQERIDLIQRLLRKKYPLEAEMFLKKAAFFQEAVSCYHATIGPIAISINPLATQGAGLTAYFSVYSYEKK